MQYTYDMISYYKSISTHEQVFLLPFGLLREGVVFFICGLLREGVFFDVFFGREESFSSSLSHVANEKCEACCLGQPRASHAHTCGVPPGNSAPKLQSKSSA